IPSGSVIDQNPSAGQPVTAGSTVAYTVSKGPQPTPTPSPTPVPTPTPTPAPINVGDYRCMTLGQAGGEIEADQFRTGNVTGDEAGPADHGLPAAAQLVAVERQPARIEPAIAKAAGDGPPEVAAGCTAGGGALADPAPGRFGLGRSAMRTAPHGHGAMVAANAAAGGAIS